MYVYMYMLTGSNAAAEMVGKQGEGKKTAKINEISISRDRARVLSWQNSYFTVDGNLYCVAVKKQGHAEIGEKRQGMEKCLLN